MVAECRRLMLNRTELYTFKHFYIQYPHNGEHIPAVKLEVKVSPVLQGKDRDRIIGIYRSMRELEDSTFAECKETRPTVEELRFILGKIPLRELNRARSKHDKSSGRFFSRGMLAPSLWRHPRLSNRWIEVGWGSTPLPIYYGTVPLIFSQLSEEQKEIAVKVLRTNNRPYLRNNFPPSDIIEGDEFLKRIYEMVRKNHRTMRVHLIGRTRILDGGILVPEVIGASIVSIEKDGERAIVKPEQPIVLEFNEHLVWWVSEKFKGQFKLHERFAPGKYFLIFSIDEGGPRYTFEFGGPMARLPPIEEIPF